MRKRGGSKDEIVPEVVISENNVHEHHLKHSGDEHGDDSWNTAIFLESDLSDESLIAIYKSSGDPNAHENAIKVVIEHQQQKNQDIRKVPDEAVQRANRVR